MTAEDKQMSIRASEFAALLGQQAPFRVIARQRGSRLPGRRTAKAGARTLLLGLLCIAQLARAELDVRFTTDVKWVIAPYAKGIVSRTRDGLVVTLSRLTLTVGATVDQPVQVRGVRVGLAFTRPDGRWDVSHWSEYATLDVELKPGEDMELKNVSGIVRVGAEQSLEGRWLLIQCSHVFHGRPASTYAHSSTTLFDAAPAGALR